MEDKKLQEIFRKMAWERAKGELHSIIETIDEGDSNYDLFIYKLDDFIEAVEGYGVLDQ